jgi:hypothetical protein
VGQAAGVLEQLAEGQEQLRAELGLLAERLEQLEQAQTRLQAGTGTALVELERRSAPSRVPLWTAIAALVLAAAALVLV